jgi:hypothetical protein
VNLSTSPASDPAKDRYRHFSVAIYSRVYEVQQMADLEWLRSRFDVMQRYIKVDKVYLETHRDLVVAEEATLEQAREFLTSRGVQVSGGITITVNERNRFETYCYTKPEHRQKLKEVVAYTARLFDEVILDDFFFTTCKCASCIAAKGEQSWTEFRLALMTEAARELVLAPARAANPNVKVVIKYPNWYEHFQGLGFNLETQPPLFDGLYTGTETRDPIARDQHLQPYHGYSIFRYFENIKPGYNLGGWVDTGGMTYLDRYVEQFWLTLFAKAPELTLFDFRQLQYLLTPSLRGAWQDAGNTSFDFDEMIAPLRQPDGAWPGDTTLAPAVGYALEQVDDTLGELGEPLGLACYRPYHATGEDFLHSYLGMLGLPIDLRPDFPTEAETILLTESAKFDPEIVEKIEGQLTAGKTVVVTSGLYKALQDRGIRDIVELEVTDRKASVQDYHINRFQASAGDAPILIPHINYLTNDSWEMVSGVSQTTGHPIFHYAAYGGTRLYVLTIPDNFDDLYKLPVDVWSCIREVLLRDLYVRVDGPAQVMLFVYDNDTFIVESFLPEPATVRIVVDEGTSALQDVRSRVVLEDKHTMLDRRQQRTGKVSFDVTIAPHSYRVFRTSNS